MFIRALSYLIIFGLLTLCARGQGTPAVKWTRIEANNEVSVAVPEGFLVDGEKEKTGKTHRVLAGVGATTINLVFLDMTLLKGRITRPRTPAPPEEGEEVFKAEGLEGSRRCSGPGKRVSCTIWLTSDRYNYVFTVDSLSEKPEIAKIFLASIMVRGKAVFIGEPALVSETRQLAQLTTSPEITRALTRTPNDPVKVTQKRLSDHTGDKELPDAVSPAVILEWPLPEGLGKIALGHSPNFGKKRTGADIVVRGARAAVTFLASGEIGEVVIYSDEKKNFIDECIDAVKKIKFIPAREDGKAVDSVQTVSYILNFL
jgi:hypothetical protein